MGSCCSIHIKYGGGDGHYMDEGIKDRKHHHHHNNNNTKVDHNKADDEFEDVKIEEDGSIMRLQGASKNVSMYTQRGRKGINQDAMVVCENFTGAKDTTYCGVFDGHGPSGHKVARYVRDQLPSLLSNEIKLSMIEKGKNKTQNKFFDSCEAGLIKSFQHMDERIHAEPTVESYCSGTTAVNIIKKGEHLAIANLGDSRAILCTRGNEDELLPVQLTNDLKPDIPGEFERIKKCQGRVFAMVEEPDVYRVWMPDEDCPGLAMARAFGDFCLKNYGLISQPEISYRKLTKKDEFVVLATDGVWDVLTNYEVIKTVACIKHRSLAAKAVVKRAVRAWKTKYPGSKIDDCAVVCLFFRSQQPVLTKSMSGVSYNTVSQVEGEAANGKEDLAEDVSALDGISVANTLVNLPYMTEEVPPQVSVTEDKKGF